jgi:hypothetical protein
MVNRTTDLLYSWERFQAFAAKQGFTIINFGAQVNYAISQNELDVVQELVDRLVIEAEKCGGGTVSAIPIAWGSLSGGIKLRFSDPRQATLWKLGW